jgi:integrase
MDPDAAALPRGAEDGNLQRFSRFHDLRHSFASALAKAGRPERQIQEWCGHSSPSVTRKYMRSFAPEQAADLEAVDAAFRVAVTSTAGASETTSRHHEAA